MASRKKTLGSKDVGVNPKSITLAIAFWLQETFKILPETPGFEKFLIKLKEVIQDAPLNNDLPYLRKRGCNEIVVLWYLSLAAGRPLSFLLGDWFREPGVKSVKNLFGLNARQLKALQVRLVKDADQIGKLNHEWPFGLLLCAPHLELFQPLPRLLKGYVSLLELASAQFGYGQHLYRNIAKALLTAYVKHKTHRFCDERLARLIATVTDSVTYDAQSHRDWRNQYAGLIASLSPSPDSMASLPPLPSRLKA